MANQIDINEKLRIDASAPDDQLRGYLNRHSNFFVPALIILMLFYAVVFYFEWFEFIIPIILLSIATLFIFYFIQRYVGTDFIRQFAVKSGFSYSAEGTLKGLDGLIFELGKERTVSDVVTGKLEDRNLSLFIFSYRMDADNSKPKMYITAFKFDIRSNAPHILLENIKHGFVAMTFGKFNRLEKISLEGDFDKYFRLRVEKGFATEALQIFSPNIMAELIDKYRHFGLEIIGDHFYIYKPRLVCDSRELEELYSCAKYFADKIAPVLDRMKTHEN